jgi:hypothetical protein
MLWEQALTPKLLVQAIARCSPGRAQAAILFVRRALYSLDRQPGSTVERHAAENAAACLYCLAVARLIAEEERDAIVSRARAGDLVVSVPTDANIVCAIVAMAVSGGELDLVPGKSETLPQAEYVFDVKAPESSDQLEADFAHLVYLKVFENDGDAQLSSVERGSDLLPDQWRKLMSKLRARFETYRDVRNKTVGVIL